MAKLSNRPGRRLLDRLVASRLVRLLCSVLLFAATYGVASWAIDSGNLLVYALGFVLLALALRVLVAVFQRKK